MSSCRIGDEGVRVGASRLNGTLRESYRAVGLSAALLKHAVEVQRRNLVSKRVFGNDNDCVTYVCFNHGYTAMLLVGVTSWTREYLRTLSIYTDDLSGVTIWCSLSG